jgi:broad specificity phosphatase PhoE
MVTKTPPSDKILIFIRHAHRDKKTGRDQDNGLSATGKKQAQGLTKYFEKAYPKAKPVVLSSPKRRCVETVEPIARKFDVTIQLSFILDEGGKIEQKVKSFDRWWKDQAPDLTIVCSHGDWLPAALKRLTGVRADMAKGGWAEIHYNQGKPVLVNLVGDLSES